MQSIPGLAGPADEAEAALSVSPSRGPRADPDQPPRLVWSGSAGAPPDLANILIDREQLILGSDPEQADICIPFPEVSTQHACLVRSEGGSVTIADLGSDGGTWVNYTPVSGAGILLNHNDRVQIGEAAFRYRIGNGG
jgi:predicted component of type VI protein secretion system